MQKVLIKIAFMQIAKYVISLQRMQLKINYLGLALFFIVRKYMFQVAWLNFNYLIIKVIKYVYFKT